MFCSLSGGYELFGYMTAVAKPIPNLSIAAISNQNGLVLRRQHHLRSYNGHKKDSLQATEMGRKLGQTGRQTRRESEIYT